MTVAENKKTILVIDDAPEILAIISAILKSEYRVVVAKDGETGLRLAANQPLPSLILLDYLMPGMKGDEVCRALKSHALTRDIPVVFITTVSDETVKGYLMGFGARDYIKKPIDAGILLNRVHSYLGDTVN